MKLITLMFFILITSTIYLSMHFYFLIRLKIDFNIPKYQTILLGIIIFILSHSFIVSEIVKRNSGNKFLVLFGEIWIGFICISASFLIVKDLISIFSGNSKILITITYSLIIITTLISLRYGLKSPVIKEIKITTTKNQTLKLNNFIIVQLTDLHLDFSSSEKKLETIINKVNGIKPDVIVITGDLLDADIAKNEKFCETLKKLKAKYGVYAITGNHEYYAGIDKFINLCKKTNIHYLNNENIFIDEKIYVAGVNDRTGKRFPGYEPDFNKTFKNIDFTKPVVLLNHEPLNFNESAEKGVDLQLSGHIHNGQIPPVFPSVYLMYKYPCGLYTYKKSFIYTSSGTGTWGPPMRIFSNNEIVKIVIN